MAAHSSSVTVTPWRFAVSFMAAAGTISVVRCKKPSGSGVPLR